MLGALGAVSGLLSALVPGPSLDSTSLQPGISLYMVLAGVWFGMVVAFGVWRFASRTAIAVAGTLLATWIAWEVAVNLALQLDDNWLKLAGLPEPARTYVTGLLAGEVGALLTWAGAACFSPQLRRAPAAVGVATVGAMFGLLLYWSMTSDILAILFVPWQTAVAATFGFFWRSERSV
jgi:hypothetical protein